MKKILVPIDFSECSVNALNYAAALASHLEAKIVLLHVYQVPIPATDLPVLEIISSEEMEKNFSGRMHHVVREQKKELGWDADVTILNIPGIVHSEINRTVAEKGIDLLVMGMRGRATVVDRVFGSTATEMIKKAKCPLLLVPEDAEFQMPDSMAVAIDFNQPEDIRKLGLAKELAKHFNARIRVFSILDEKQDDPSDKAVVFDALDQQLKDTEHSIHFQVHQPVTEGILNFVDEHQSKMLVIFHHSHNVFTRIFMSIHSQQVSFNIRIPMLVFTEQASYAPAG